MPSRSVFWRDKLLSYTLSDFEYFYTEHVINQWQCSFISNIFDIAKNNRRWVPTQRQQFKIKEVLETIDSTISVYFEAQSYVTTFTTSSAPVIVPFDSNIRRRDPNDIPSSSIQASLAVAPLTTSNLRFGIEIETAGVRRRIIADAIASAFETEYSYEGGTYDAYSIRIEGHKWYCKSDASIASVNGVSKGCEVISPPLFLDDLPVLRKVIEAVKATEAIPHRSCGIHIHIDGSNFELHSIKFLISNYAAIEELIYKCFGVLPSRESSYARKLPNRLVNRITASSVTSFNRARSIWYSELGGSSSSRRHYDPSRYHGLNLHSLFYNGTVEFRFFNASLNPSKITAYVLFCVFICANALNKDIVYRRVDISEVTLEFMQSSFKEMLGLGERPWARRSDVILFNEKYEYIVYRL